MALLVWTSVMMALAISGVLGAHDGPVPPQSRNPEPPKPKPPLTELGIKRRVAAEGFLEIEARVDIRDLLDLLGQIPAMRGTILQLVEEVKTLKNGGAVRLENELKQLKKGVREDLEVVQNYIVLMLEHNANETANNADRLASIMDKKSKEATCDLNALTKANIPLTEKITQSSKELERLINNQIRSEFSKIVTVVESNARVLSDMDELFHGDKGGQAYTGGGSDSGGRRNGSGTPDVGTNGGLKERGDCHILPLKKEMRKEMDSLKNLVKNMHKEFMDNISKPNQSNQKLDDLEASVKKSVDGIEHLHNLIKELAVKQEQYFNSTIEEQTEVIQVVRKTHNFVRKNAKETSAAAAKMEQAAARSMAAASRALGCESPK